ncbi:CubicO group peptidase (beta-lactamase class C family) [Actinocorallia herbida]|uniref:CubicO group peptidase (Beta-lactamase class C family) n=1 Tax=Actinocorallia herbida TaxID=58109 RepID=A0A3N1D875_9ACTN|nr:serine hydrolase domain-containing protein [Actinocorallia herbida]ROO89730.1 CubicO group peptidase (beta-lactamase class C family) [Actinocorallia herbida]
MDWGGRLAELAAAHGVPGASLALRHRGVTAEHATGVLSTATNVPVTPGAVFQIGSVTKVWTATQVMLLAERGDLDLDAPVRDALPEFAVADPVVSVEATIRQLLSHTSGIDGDLFLDTGRGDDCLEKYVAACAELTQLHPPGATQSYVNAAYSVLGRIIEKATGGVWDRALREMVLDPLGLDGVCTLPEEALLRRAAVGHLGKGEKLRPTPVWGLMRSIGPAGLICATAADTVAFGAAHLAPGLLTEASLTAMRAPQIEVPNPHGLGTHWGLGWILDTWDGHPVLWHSGSTIGQNASLWVVPDADLVVALLSNGGNDGALAADLAREIFAEVAGIAVRETPEPSAGPVAFDPADYTGLYERRHVITTITEGPRGLHARIEVTTPALADLAEPLELALSPVDEVTFVGTAEGNPAKVPFVFHRLPDGSPHVHYSARTNPRTKPADGTGRSAG